MKLGGGIKIRRLSARDEYKFVNAKARSLLQHGKESKMPDEKLTGHLFWRRPIDSRSPARSPAASAGFTIHLVAARDDVLLRQAAFRRGVLRVGRSVQKCKNPDDKTHRGF